MTAERLAEIVGRLGLQLVEIEVCTCQRYQEEDGTWSIRRCYDCRSLKEAWESVHALRTEYLEKELSG